ncbi:hypothetical protein VPNG_06401 [Cytospora leucostoma]|uniref:Uncharacterized protein n=1 Tax=Cytospora leucostoma TaxID=1230097 RepID=A0A423WZ90_9PEZI|nr:hypothetical protein VPNG_06401 [Cytospora leucostoma]
MRLLGMRTPSGETTKSNRFEVDNDSQPDQATGKSPSRGVEFKAVPYNATTAVNEPRHVSTSDHESLLTAFNGPIRVSNSDQQPLLTSVDGPIRVSTPDHEAPLTAARSVPFPVSFNFYCLSLFHGRYYLGVHKADPLYRIKISWPTISLYNGLDTKDPLIGALVHRSHFHRKKRPRDEVIIQSGTIRLEAKGRFTVDVPLANEFGSRKEAFQWRPTRGQAVKVLGKHSGLKLVRLATDVTQGSGYIASGGGETVAVLGFRKLNLRRRSSAAFQFLGIGAQGVLGEDWEVAAVMTAIGLWDKHQRK